MYGHQSCTNDAIRDDRPFDDILDDLIAQDSSFFAEPKCFPFENNMKGIPCGQRCLLPNDSFLQHGTFLLNLLTDVSETEHRELEQFCCDLPSNPNYNSVSLLEDTVAKFRKYGEGNPNHWKELKVKLYSIFTRNLLLKDGFTMSKDAFLTDFGDLIAAHPKSRVEGNDTEIQILFWYLSPVLALRMRGIGFDNTFFQGKMTIIELMCEFMQGTPGRQYRSGGAKTQATLLRYACLDRITGNQRNKRNRLSHSKRQSEIDDQEIASI